MNLDEILKDIPGEPATKLFFELLSELINHLSISSDDERVAVNYTRSKKGISVNLNQRIVFGLWTDKQAAVFLFMLPSATATFLHSKHGFKMDEEFKNPGPAANVLYIPFLQVGEILDQNIKAQWLLACKQYLTVGTKCSYRQYHLPELFDLAVNAHSQRRDVVVQPHVAAIRYFLGGAAWSGTDDQTPRFLKEGSWENGYNDRFIDEVKDVPVGSLIAIKASFAKGKESILRIKAVGTVTGNPGDGKRLIVNWQGGFTPFDLTGLGSYRQTFHEVTNQEDIDAIFNNEGKNHMTQIGKQNQVSDLPLNRILYGPPGTGKTYKLQTIIRDMKLEQPATTSTTRDYQSFAASFHWWQLLAIALLDVKRTSVPDLLKHPLLTAKFGLSSIQHPPQRLWSTLQHHTVLDCPHVKGVNRFGELIFYKEADSTWRLDNEADFKEQFPYLVTAWEELQKGSTPQEERRHFTFITCHQSLTYEDFIEGIKPKLQEKEDVAEDEKVGIDYEIRRGLFYKACDEAAKRAGFVSLLEALNKSKAERKAAFQAAKNEGRIHVLFLDEINRCNVSAVFGELITLIEDDKRLGMDNEIAHIELPYSQKQFGVPANLYIIGTMNTADRSVEALDTALRRRFSFEAMEPDYSKVPATSDGIDLQLMLKTMNERITALLTKDHAIGHAWLMGVNDVQGLRGRFRDKIMPLLQEYFYNNYAKIGLVVGDTFFEEQKKVDRSIFASFVNGKDLVDDYSEKVLFSFKDSGALTIDDFKSIYQ